MAAIDLFSTVGFHSATMKDLARKTGLSTEEVYGSFSSKDDILSKIYSYFRHYYMRDYYPLDSLLEAVETEPPHAVLLRMYDYQTEPEFNEFLNRLFTVTSFQIYTDGRARDLITWAMFELQESYLRPVLEKMIQLGKIEPLDIDSYLLLHCSICHSSTAMMHAGHPITFQQWLDAQKLFVGGMIREIRAAPQ